MDPDPSQWNIHDLKIFTHFQSGIHCDVARFLVNEKAREHDTFSIASELATNVADTPSVGLKYNSGGSENGGGGDDNNDSSSAVSSSSSDSNDNDEDHMDGADAIDLRAEGDRCCFESAPCFLSTTTKFIYCVYFLI